MSDLRRDLQSAINLHCSENGSNTPDFILAEYLCGCLAAFDAAVNARSAWYGPVESEEAVEQPSGGEQAAEIERLEEALVALTAQMAPQGLID